MGLKFPAEWRFEGIGLEVPIDAFNELISVVNRLANGSSDAHEVYEIFKSAYGSHSVSSSASWAETDMGNAMRSERGNAALFVDYFWYGIEEAKRRKIPVPTHATVNKVLQKYGVPLEIQPPELLLTQGDIMTVAPGADGGFSEGSPRSSFITQFRQFKRAANPGIHTALPSLPSLLQLLLHTCGTTFLARVDSESSTA